MSDKTPNDANIQTPAALLLAAEPKALKLNGSYDTHTDTWSNRFYETAATKKHNEAM